MDITKTVREFTLAAEENVPNKPRKLNLDEIDFVKEMVSDELEELEFAEDVVDQADALADAVYYLVHCAIKNGINLDNVLRVVHSANMKKVVNGKVIRRPDGKIMKPDGWEDPKPYLDAVIALQEEYGSFENVPEDKS